MLQLKKSRYLVSLWAASILLGCMPKVPVSGRLETFPSANISTKKLPEEMTPLSGIQELNRAGLAVLLTRELAPEELEFDGKVPIVVDVSDHWAREEVLRAVQSGLMPVFANHRFEPDQAVNRGEMAQVLSRILEKKKISPSQREVSPGLPADLSKGHLNYPVVRRVLEAGLMELDPSGRFSIAGAVSGVQALYYFKRIKKLPY